MKRKPQNTYGFPLMADVLPETPKPDGAGWYIEHVEIDEEYCRFARMRAVATNFRDVDMIEPGTYTMLRERIPVPAYYGVYHTKTWMSDTWMERMSNAGALQAAKGDVLLVGLGLGMLPLAVSRKREVKSVTVLEIQPDVIRLVTPHVIGPKLRVVLADGRTPPLRGRAFDYIYVDIWQDICVDYWDDYKALLRQYRRFARDGATVTAWQKDHIQKLVRAGRWR